LSACFRGKEIVSRNIGSEKGFNSNSKPLVSGTGAAQELLTLLGVFEQQHGMENLFQFIHIPTAFV
jgi:hypothetical protein